MKTLLTLLMFSALTAVFTACGNQKEIVHATTSTIRDSVVYIDRVVVDTIRIPSEDLEVKVPVEILKRDTVIQFQKGRVSTRLEYRNGSIQVFSRCDSLEKLVLSKDQQLKQYRNQEFKINPNPENKVPWPYKAALWGWIIAALYFVGKKVFKFYSKKK